MKLGETHREAFQSNVYANLCTLFMLGAQWNGACTGLHGGKYMVFTHPLSYLRTHTKSALAYLRVYCNITTLTSHIGSNKLKTFTRISTRVDQIVKGGRKKPH